MAISQIIPIDPAVLDTFCRQWKIAKLELFGSFLSGNVHAESDIDLLVTFAPEAQWGLFDHVQMERELGELMGRKVDLVSRRAIEASHNAIRRNAILGNTRTVYG
jgi:predicted nucleotidyltransferase